jgi:cytochrome P450
MNISLDKEKLVSHRYEYYQELREIGDVLYCQENKSFIVLGYKDIIQILKNFKDFSSKSDFPYDTYLLNNDPPNQLENKKLLNEKDAIFSKKYIHESQEVIENCAQKLFSSLDKLQVFDLIRDFAEPFSFMVILNHLGLDITRIEEVKQWTDKAIGFEALGDYNNSLAIWTRVKPIIKELVDKKKSVEIEKIIVSLNKCPSHISDEEILDFYKVLILGGSETTPNLIGFCFKYLFEDLSLFTLIQNNSGLVSTFIDEVLRLESPTQFIERTSTSDVIISGVKIPANSRILLCIGSANRDESIFKNPNDLKLDRFNNKAISFGYGAHYCLGASLAYLEVQIALKQFILNYQNIILVKENKVKFKKSLYINGMVNLECIHFPNYQSLISTIKCNAIEFIEKSFFKSYSVTSYEIYPNTADSIWLEARESPFIHANVLLSLNKSGMDFNNPLLYHLRNTLKNFVEKGKLWRFWTLQDSINNVPPDFDDMSVCSLVFEKEVNFRTPPKLFHLFQSKEGSIHTWLYPKIKLAFHYPSIFWKLLREKKSINNTLSSNLLDYKDHELGVIANVLTYLGSNANTSRMIQWSINSVRLRKIKGQFYDDELVVYYHLSRAYSYGIVEFQELKSEIITRLKEFDSKTKFPELLLKYLILKNFQSELYLSETKLLILNVLGEKPDAYQMHFKYFTSKDRNYYCGSPLLTAAWFLEATKEW